MINATATITGKLINAAATLGGFAVSVAVANSTISATTEVKSETVNASAVMPSPLSFSALIINGGLVPGAGGGGASTYGELWVNDTLKNY